MSIDKKFDYKELYDQFLTKLGAKAGDGKPVNLKQVTIIVIIFLLFYGVYVYVIFKNKPESAYANLQRFAEQEKLKLMDTRLPSNQEE